MLFKTIVELKKYVSVNSSLNFNSVLPFIQQAERKFIIAEIGPELYTKMDTDYNNGAGNGALNGAYLKLLTYIQLPLANFAMALYAPSGNVQVSDAGIQVTKDNNRVSAFEWQLDKFVNATIDAAWDGVEGLLQYLEENKADLSVWADSPSYKINKELFITSTTLFQQHFNINNSRRIYKSLFYKMRYVESTKIKPLIGATLFTSLKTQVAAGVITESNQALLDFIYPVVAKYALSKAVDERALIINDNGIQVASTSMALDKNVLTPASKSMLDALKETTAMEAEEHIAQLKSFLDANKETYTAYRDWVAPKSTSPTFTNDPNSGAYGAF